MASKLRSVLFFSFLGFMLSSYAEPPPPRHFDGDIMFSISNATACKAQVSTFSSCYPNTVVEPNTTKTILCHPGSKFVLNYNPDKIGHAASQLVLTRPTGTNATYAFQSFAVDQDSPIQYQIITGYKGLVVLYGKESLIVTDAPNSQFFIALDNQYPIPIAISDISGKKICP